MRYHLYGKKAYKLAQAEEHLLVSYYTEYQDPQTRTHQEGMPKFGLTEQEYYDYNYIVPKEHSYRKEPALALLKKCFEQ